MNLDYSITETIPVADHVYKFLVKRCGSDTYTANRNDIIGNIVLSSLGKNNDLKISKTRHTKSFNIVIKEYSYLRNGIFLGVKSGQAFNKMIDKLFRDEMYFHVYVNSFKSKEQFLEGIRNYLKIYDITEDDIKLESIYRDFKRKKEDLQTMLL